jgi:hypothetical protein
MANNAVGVALLGSTGLVVSFVTQHLAYQSLMLRPNRNVLI